MKAEFLTPVVTIFDEEGNLDKEGNKNGLPPSYIYRLIYITLLRN